MDIEQQVLPFEKAICSCVSIYAKTYAKNHFEHYKIKDTQTLLTPNTQFNCASLDMISYMYFHVSRQKLREVHRMAPK